MSDRWQQIEELYHSAREDRAVLDNADPELRREVESLLAQEKGAGFLEAPALEVAARRGNSSECRSPHIRTLARDRLRK